jgi:predicted membrane-bound dolichyl-phosphate-mannose-protein mannosyltransferase
MKMPHESIQSRIMLFIVALMIFIELFAFRGILRERFDTTYMYDLYEHSQWSIGKSIRSISDAGLYEVAGHQLVTKNTFYDINPEVPPLGKYIIGISILLFHNGKILSAFLYLISIGLFYLVVSELVKKPLLKLLAVLLYVSEPLIFSQAGLSMLDLPQLCALLAHMLILLRIHNHKKISLLNILLAGISFGAFISIKIGFLSLIILFVDLFILYEQKK